ncbi:D-glycero-beta-D-manno-heptose 1-phosphate adenylyltransferase [Henriciella sp. AS95]|uniref:D-glycero-beta-D-manno-heptose 1-phosphate adenylyltransferase n=1 Tax=Henriciella sp. AS95 TaxID=3135782 RepID=UPI0031804103
MKQRLASLIERGRGKTVLCVGDLMLDRFVYGSVNRISPESPVPVLQKSSVSEMPGGAGNVARNMASMGLNVILIGCVGEDEDGERLASVMDSEPGIDSRLARSSSFQTIVKTRFVASNQQLLRVDTEARVPDIGLTADVIISAIGDAVRAKTCSAIVVSDYAKGSVTPDIFRACLDIASGVGIPVLVDPKSNDLAVYRGATLIKPNANELAAATGLSCADDKDVEAALVVLKSNLPETNFVVTRAEKGMSWITDGKVHHRHGEAREVYDVSGAGDTSMAAMALGYAADAALEEAVALAVTASGIAVGKTGTATVSASEIRMAIEPRHHLLRAPVLERGLLQTKTEQWKSDGLRVGFTNGCFDILHPGHMKLLESARSMCDRLVVAINSDTSVKRLKGDNRPINSEHDRATIMSGINAVDAVTIFEEDTPEALIELIVPDLLVKGGDYSIETIVGADTVLKNGGEVHIVELEAGHSTTNIIERSKT